MLAGITITFVEIRDPEVDTDTAVDLLFTSITVILGALLGLLAGKNEGLSKLNERPDKSEDEITRTGPSK